MKVYRRSGVNGYKVNRAPMSQTRCRSRLNWVVPPKNVKPFGPFDHFDDEEIAWLFYIIGK